MAIQLVPTSLNCIDSWTKMKILRRINKLVTMWTSLRVLFAFPKYSVSPDAHRNSARDSANVDQTMLNFTIKKKKILFRSKNGKWKSQRKVKELKWTWSQGFGSGGKTPHSFSAHDFCLSESMWGSVNCEKVRQEMQIDALAFFFNNLILMGVLMRRIFCRRQNFLTSKERRWLLDGVGGGFYI